MTDVYEKYGIPMPESEPQEKFPEEVELTTNAVESDWQKRHEEERDRDLRLRCIEIAYQNMSGHQSQILKAADQMYKFIKSGEIETQV